MTANPAVKEQGNGQLPSPKDESPKSEDYRAVQTPSTADKKRKRTSASNGKMMIEANPEPPYPAATDEEKRAWQGFCEIESDPVSEPLKDLASVPNRLNYCRRSLMSC